MIVKGNDAHVKVSRGGQEAFNDHDGYRSQHDRRDNALIVTSGHNVVIADTDSAHRVHVVNGRSATVKRDDFPGVPGTIDIVVSAFETVVNWIRLNTLQTLGTSAEQKVGSLVLTDDPTNPTNSTSDGMTMSDPQSFVLDASKTNQTQIYLVANPSSSNTTASQGANSSDIPVMIELPIFVPSRASDVPFCATYDPNPPAPVPFTMQPCLDPTAEGIDDATVHKSQTFLYNSQTGAIKPKWFSDPSAGNNTNSTQSSSPSQRPTQADVVSARYDVSSSSSAAGSAALSTTANAYATIASASETESATAPTASASSSPDGADDGTLPQNVALVFTPTGPSMDSMKPGSDFASFAPEDFSSTMDAMASSSTAATDASTTPTPSGYSVQSSTVSDASVMTASAFSMSEYSSLPDQEPTESAAMSTDTPLVEADVQTASNANTQSADATSTVWASDVSPATMTASGGSSETPVFGIESVNAEDQSSFAPSTTSWGSGVYPASETYSASGSAPASSSTDSAPPLLANDVQSFSDGNANSQTASTATTSWASGVYPVNSSPSSAAVSSASGMDGADLQPPAASSSQAVASFASTPLGSDGTVGASSTDIPSSTAEPSIAETTDSSSASMSMASGVYPVSSGASASSSNVSPVAEEEIDPSTDNESQATNSSATSTYWAPDVAPASSTSVVPSNSAAVEPELEASEWLFQGQRRWFGF